MWAMTWCLALLLIGATEVISDDRQFGLGTQSPSTEASHRVPLQRVERAPLSPSELTELHEMFQGQWQPDRQSAQRDVSAPLSLASTAMASPVGLSEGYAEVRKDLDNKLDAIYTASLDIGTPRRPVSLIVDTGSSDLWVKTENEGGYKASASSSADVSPTTQTKQYGKGEIVGAVSTDRFCTSQICEDSQTFLLVTEVRDIPPQVHFDGLLGLGMPAGATVGQPAGLYRGRPVIVEGGTFLERLSKSGQFGHVSFALELFTQGEGTESSISFGDADELISEAQARGLSSGVQVPVMDFPVLAVKSIFWSVKIDISVSGHDLVVGNATFTTSTVALLDSGTTLITLPTLTYSAVMEVAFGSFLTTRCTLIPEGPMKGLKVCDCGIPVNPVTFSIQDDSGVAVSVVLRKEEIFKPLPIPSKIPLCAISIMQTPKQMPIIILGETYLRHVHSIFDFDRKRVTLFPRSSQAQSVRLASSSEQTAARTETHYVRISTEVVWSSCIAFVISLGLAVSLAVKNFRRRGSSLRSPLLDA